MSKKVLNLKISNLSGFTVITKNTKLIVGGQPANNCNGGDCTTNNCVHGNCGNCTTTCKPKQ